MKLHEYQAKKLLAKFGAPTPEAHVASTPAEAVEAARKLGGRAVVKAQCTPADAGRRAA